MRLPTSRSRRLATRFAQHRGGMGAVEFALIAPVLLLLFLGSTDLANGITVDRRVKAVAGTVNDLASQSERLDRADLQALFRLATVVMEPFPVDSMTLTMTSISIDANGRATVDWACGSTGAVLPQAGDPVALPAQFSALRSRTVLHTDAHYLFFSPIAEVLTGPIVLSGTNIVMPRYTTRIESTGCSGLSLGRT